MNPSSQREAPNIQQQRKGMARLWHALRYSIAGLRCAWDETAFRQEALLAMVLVPLAFLLGNGWVETALLAGSIVLVMVVELLNSGIEAVVDRFGPEWNELSKRAKDLGSAAVLLSLLLCAATWCAAIWSHDF